MSNQDSTQQKNIYRPAPPRLVQVKRIVDITPGMRSITFTSDDLDNYPSHTGGAHLKIFLPVEGQTKPTIPTLTDKGPRWHANQPRALVRTYRVRARRPELKELDIALPVHEGAGPAINFALNATGGE
ncbi:siderophore-interacting protein [Proteus mirabilis]